MTSLIPKDPTASAEAEARLGSALIYSTNLEAGIIRKMGKSGFLYYGPDRNRITDPAEIARINALAIPPAYTDVVISANASAHLQAIGIDARGRKQYRYHPDWHAERGRTKFERLVEFGNKLPDIRERVDRDLQADGLPVSKALATIVWMLDNLYIRVGNSTYAQENGSYGLTTLRRRHVKIDGSNLKFRFRGKSGKEWDLAHSDRRIANVIKRLQELPGQHLFQYVCDEGGCRPVSSNDVNSYIREMSGQEFSSRQFRTWGATCMAANLLAPMTAETGQRAQKHQLNEVIDAVAARLVNTRSVCRSSYIHPAVLDHFQSGKLSEILRLTLPRNERYHQWMDEEEIRVLQWLKRISRSMSPGKEASLDSTLNP